MQTITLWLSLALSGIAAKTIGADTQPWAVTAPFQTAVTLENVTLENGTNAAEAVRTFPALAPKEGQVPVLRFRMRIDRPIPAGFNNWTAISLNDTLLGASTKNKSPRLLNRRPTLTELKRGVKQERPWWHASAPPDKTVALLTFFGPAQTLDDRALSDRGELYWYVIDIADLVKAGDPAAQPEANRLVFRYTLLLEHVNNTRMPLMIEDISVGTIPAGLIRDRLDESADAGPADQSPVFTPIADFRLEPGRTLRVMHGSNLLLASDDIPGYGPAWDTCAFSVSNRDTLAIANTWTGKSEGVMLRREVGVTSNRVELTVKARLPAYQNVTNQSSFAYTFRVPWVRLQGTRWKAWTGRVHKPATLAGSCATNQPDGLIVAAVRYIAFSGGTTNLVFDLNPHGLLSRSDYGSGGFLGMWSLAKKGDFAEFSCGQSARFYGGLIGAKALVYEGPFAFERVHAMQKYTEFGALPVTHSLCFGATNPPPAFRAVPPEGRPYARWRDAASVRLLPPKGPALLDGACSGSGSNELTVDVPPGVYLVTLQTGSFAAGPFQVRLNGELKAQAVQSDGKTVTRLALSSYCRDGKMRIGFDTTASWALSTVSLQPVIYAYEDFTFDHGPWLVEDIATPEG